MPAPAKLSQWSAGSSSKPPAGGEDDERRNELQRDVAGAGKPYVLENGGTRRAGRVRLVLDGSESKIVLAGAEPLAQVRDHVSALLTVDLPPSPAPASMSEYLSSFSVPDTSSPRFSKIAANSPCVRFRRSSLTTMPTITMSGLTPSIPVSST